jgi:hypothetical protein
MSSSWLSKWIASRRLRSRAEQMTSAICEPSTMTDVVSLLGQLSQGKSFEPYSRCPIEADSCPLIDELVVSLREASAAETDRSVQVHAYRIGHDVHVPVE